MFKDTEKQLQRLEEALLAQEQEEWEQEDPLLDDDDDFGEDAPENYRNFSNHYRAYNTDRTDWDPEELTEELEEKPKTGIWGLCAIILLLIGGIFLLLAWLYYGGGL